MPFQLKSDLIHKFWFLCLLILFVINSVLIAGFQVWFVYGIGAPITDETIPALDDYAGFAVIDHAEGEILQSWLLKSPSGETHIVTLEKHPFAEQYRIVRGGTGIVDSSDHQDTVIADSARVILTVTDQETISRYDENGMNFELSRKFHISVPLVYFLYSVLLLAAEVAVYILIEKLRK